MVSSLEFSHNNLMLASAFLTQYFACLRASELCLNPFTGSAPLRSHINFPTPHVMSFAVASSKNAPNGFTVHIGCSKSPTCAVCTMKYYISCFPASPSSYLFILPGARPLDYPEYNSALKTVIQSIGLDPTSYSTHSLRAVAATQAAAAGLQ